MGYIFDALNKKDGNGASQDTGDESVRDAVDALDDVSAQPLPFAPIDHDQSPAPSVLFEDEEIESAQCTNHKEFDAIEIAAPDKDTHTNGDVPLATLSASQSKTWWRWGSKRNKTTVDDRLVSKTNPGSALAEEYRAIRTTLLARHNSERHLVHTITSATPQEGKTITCMNLGMAFAELHNRKTIVIECDLRLPTFEKLLKLDHPTGLIPYLRGEVSLSEIITAIEPNGLSVITAGGRANNDAVQLLSSPRMSALIQSLRAKYDHVIIDTPPAVELADAGILGAQSDDVLLVARMRRTPRPLIEQAVRTLQGYNAPVAGMIATDNPRLRLRGYGSKYGSKYGYAYAYGQSSSKRRKKQRGRQAA